MILATNKIILALILPMLAMHVLCAQQKPVRKVATPPLLQKPPEPDTWIGIFAGPNLNQLDYSDKLTTISGTNTGFHAGIFYEKKLSERFALEPAMEFAMRGGKITDVDSSLNARLMNVEIPLNFLYLYKQFIIGAGPNFCYAISGKLKSKSDNRNIYDPSESFERTLKRFEFGANFTAGYIFKNGILVSANFSPGFTSIYKGDHSAPSNLHAATKMFGLSIGYRFVANTED
jgi:Outer membrane protein beta-barrel domain